VERSLYSDWLLLDVLFSVEGIASGYWCTGWGRSFYSDWLRLDDLWSVLIIATEYGYTGWGV